MTELPDNRLSWPLLWLWLGFGAVAVGSWWGDLGGEHAPWVFWLAAGCSAAAFQAGVAPRRAGAGREAFPAVWWLMGMCGAGGAVSVGGVFSALASGAFMNANHGRPLLENAGITAIVLGAVWMLGAVLLIVLKIVSAIDGWLRPSATDIGPAE